MSTEHDLSKLAMALEYADLAAALYLAGGSDHAARLLAAGLALGIGVSLVATRLLSSVLFRVRPTDPATYIAAAVVLGAASLAACEVPAIRATRADPARALRAEG